MTIWENAMQYQLLIKWALAHWRGERQSVYVLAIAAIPLLEIAKRRPRRLTPQCWPPIARVCHTGRTATKARAECLLAGGQHRAGKRP